LSFKTAQRRLAGLNIGTVKVTVENGAIEEGDLLVTSSRPRYAMRGTDRRRLVGAVWGRRWNHFPRVRA